MGSCLPGKKPIEAETIEKFIPPNIWTTKCFQLKCDEKDLTSCYSAKRLAVVLLRYKKFIQISNNNDLNKERTDEDDTNSAIENMYDYINNKHDYSNIQLLNDYIHLINSHNSTDDFEFIHNLFLKELSETCDILRCTFMLRNNRDRSTKTAKISEKDLYQTEDVKEMNIQQILDKIHCYYMHQYDIGYKLTKQERTQITNLPKNQYQDLISYNDQQHVQHRQRPKPQNSTNKNNQPQPPDVDDEIIYLDDDDDDEDEQKYDDKRLRETQKLLKRKRERLLQAKHDQNNDNDNDNDEDDQDDSVPIGNLTEDKSHVSSSSDENNNQPNKPRKRNRKRKRNRGLSITETFFRGGRDGKFTLSINGKKNTNDDDNDDNDVAINSSNDHSEVIYSFGFEYEYGEFNENDDWYIPPKHSSFKDELINNKAEKLTIDQYNEMKEKASDHLKSDHAKTITNNRTLEMISVDHLMSLMVYCSFDEMQRKLTETYRRISVHETPESLKKRHSIFANWGSKLKEAVQDFGTEIKAGQCKKFYHGINREMLFESTIAKFFSPLSTSTEYEVSLGFATNNGLILELQDNDPMHGHASYFDCAWLSDYGYEMEKFFIGGDSSLKTRNIIQPQSGQNYAVFIESLNILQQMLSGEYYRTPKDENPFPNAIKKCCIKLIKHELHRYEPDTYKKYKTLPEYVSDLLHYYCLHVDSVKVDWRSLHETNEKREIKGYMFLKRFFISPDFGGKWLNIKLISMLFPNIIQMSSNDVNVHEETIDCIIDFVQRNPFNNNDDNKYNDDDNKDEKQPQSESQESPSKLKKFVIYRPTKDSPLTIEDALEKYSNEIEKYGWKMSQKCKYEVYITKNKKK